MNHHILHFMILLIPIFITTTHAQTTPPKRFDQKVDVGGYSLSVHCKGEGLPTVIIEAGFGDAPLKSGSWSSVIIGLEIKQITRVCIYDRAGLGSSDPIPTESRTSQDVVNDLHALLSNANIPKPYILVGHSLGGFHVRLYADQYPDDVVGMILEDASHPDQFERTLALLPAETSDEPESLKLLRRNIRNIDDMEPNIEKFIFSKSIAQVKATKPLGDLPLVVLTQSPSCEEDTGLPPEIATKYAQVWQTLQADLANLSSNSTHIVATTACHFIHWDEPQLVIDAILKVLMEVR